MRHEMFSGIGKKQSPRTRARTMASATPPEYSVYNPSEPLPDALRRACYGQNLDVIRKIAESCHDGSGYCFEDACSSYWFEFSGICVLRRSSSNDTLQPKKIMPAMLFKDPSARDQYGVTPVILHHPEDDGDGMMMQEKSKSFLYIMQEGLDPTVKGMASLYMHYLYEMLSYLTDAEAGLGNSIPERLLRWYHAMQSCQILVECMHPAFVVVSQQQGCDQDISLIAFFEVHPMRLCIDDVVNASVQGNRDFKPWARDLSLQALLYKRIPGEIFWQTDAQVVLDVVKEIPDHVADNGFHILLCFVLMRASMDYESLTQVPASYGKGLVQIFLHTHETHCEVQSLLKRAFVLAKMKKLPRKGLSVFAYLPEALFRHIVDLLGRWYPENLLEGKSYCTNLALRSHWGFPE